MTERWGGEPTEPVPGYGRGSEGYGNQPGGEPTQMLPPNRRPAGPGGPGDPEAQRRRRAWLIAGAILAVLIIVVLVVLLITSGSGGNSSNAVNISSFNVPSTVACSGPTTIGVSWSTSNANEVVLSIDGAGPYKTYNGTSGADTVPFPCNGQPHRYTITAKSNSGGQATQTQTVTQLTAPTTTQKPTPTTQPPPPTTTTSPPPPTTTPTT
ncbi:MAG TPA: hypothetical protein VLV81_06545 [Acidimicrobiia bacterium]|nr:hypothetical protein [Acidimicrobiia bacterium]